MKDRDLPPLVPVTDKDRLKLRNVNALVGIVDRHELEDNDGEASAKKLAEHVTAHAIDSESTDLPHSCNIQLGLGGEAIVSSYLPVKTITAEILACLLSLNTVVATRQHR